MFPGFPARISDMRSRFSALTHRSENWRIGHYRNVRGLGKSMVIFRLFEKLKINYILESLRRIEVIGGGKWQNGSSTNITQNRESVWIG